MLQVQVPTPQERRNFFDDLILNQAAKAPASKKKAGKNAPYSDILVEFWIMVQNG